MTDLYGPRVWIKPLAIAALWVFCVGALAGAATIITPWYAALAKPSWQPPAALFGPVWTVIYALCAFGGARAWVLSQNAKERRALLILSLITSVLNVLWSVFFFVLKRPDWAFVEICLLWLSIPPILYLLMGIDRISALCFVPYLLWTSFAAVLNHTISGLNGPFSLDLDPKIQAFFYSGMIFEMVVVLALIEGVVLTLLYGYNRKGIHPYQLWPSLGAGISLMMAVRAAVVDAHWSVLTFWFICSLICHTIDGLSRWRR